MKFEINEIENAKLIIEIMNAGDAEEINKKSSLLMEIDIEELKERGDKKEKNKLLTQINAD